MNEINHQLHAHTPVKVSGCCSLTTYQWRHWMASSLLHDHLRHFRFSNSRRWRDLDETITLVDEQQK